MSGTLLGIYMPQNVGYSISGMLPTMKCRLQYFWYVTHHEMSAINECQVLPRNVRYIFYSRYTQNCQVLKCLIHDLKQVWLE